MKTHYITYRTEYEAGWGSRPVMKTGTWITIGVVAFIGIWIAFWAIGLSNTYNKKFVTGKAFQQNCEIVFDNTWKKIQ